MLEYIWRLLVAIFILNIIGLMLVVGYMLEAQGLFVVAYYVGIFAVPIAIAMGAFAIIDHNRENKDEEE